jgi:NADPH-dependent 2,4-dienoyl-CoA reductase/sulfur reductase-like enzyme
VTTAALANQIVADGDADLVGMVRAHIADPDLLPTSRAGRAPDVRPCVGANVCVNGLLAEQPLTCMVNPDVGQPSPVPSHDPAGATALVVGAGPAGMEAARRLAERGYTVTVLERTSQVGGQMLAWTASTSRREFRRFLEWQRRRLDQLGVEVRLEVDADTDTVDALAPDLTVLATGARPVPLSVPRTDNTVAITDPLDPAERSGRVVIYDGVGELDGMLLAERAAERGAEHVTLVTGRLHIGEGEGITTLYPMIRRLAELGVEIVERAVPVAIADGAVVLDGVFGETREPVPADALIAWCGGGTDLSFADALAARGTGTRGMGALVIGDALRPRRVTDAVRDGARAEQMAADQGLLSIAGSTG